MNPLAVERSQVDGCDLLAVEGELDIATASRMISALNETVASLELPLVVDLSRVDFLDSTGLGLLLNAHSRVRRLGQGFAISCPAGPIARVFEIAGMAETLHVRPTRHAAVLAATQAARA